MMQELWLRMIQDERARTAGNQQFFKRQGLTPSGPIALVTSRPHSTRWTLDNLILHDLLGETTDSTESNQDSSKPSLKVNLLTKNLPRSSTSGADLADDAQMPLIDLIVCHHTQSLDPCRSLSWSCLLYFPRARAWVSLAAPTARLKVSESWVFHNRSLVK